jgi:hypothetical protein
MSTSIRSQILAAINTVLNSTGTPCTFFRSRQEEFQLGELPAGNMFPDTESYQIDGKERACVLTVAIAGVVATAQDPVDDAADVLLIWIEQKLMADETLGGLAVWIEKKETQWFMEQKGAEQCGAIVKFDVNYRTALTDSTANQS